MTALLSIDGVSKRFRGLLAVDNASFRVTQIRLFGIRLRNALIRMTFKADPRCLVRQATARRVLVGNCARSSHIQGRAIVRDSGLESMTSGTETRR